MSTLTGEEREVQRIQCFDPVGRVMYRDDGIPSVFAWVCNDRLCRMNHCQTDDRSYCVIHERTLYGVENGQPKGGTAHRCVAKRGISELLVALKEHH